MLGLSFAAVPLYDMFCRITGFGGTTQVSKEAPNIVLDKVVSVRFDTNVNNLEWNFKAKSNVIDVKVGQVNKIEFEVENYGDDTSYGVASFNVSPTSFGKYYSKLGCFCFEKQTLKPNEKSASDNGSLSPLQFEVMVKVLFKKFIIHFVWYECPHSSLKHVRVDSFGSLYSSISIFS